MRMKSCEYFSVGDRGIVSQHPCMRKSDSSMKNISSVVTRLQLRQHLELGVCDRIQNGLWVAKQRGCRVRFDTKGVKEENARELSRSENADSRKEWIKYAVMRNLLLYCKLKRRNCETWLKRVNILQRNRHDLHDPTAISVSISVVIKHSDIGRRYRWRSLAATRFTIWLLYLTTSLRCNLFADLSLSAGKIKIFPCICHCKFTL